MMDDDPAPRSGQPLRRTVSSTVYGVAFRLLCILALLTVPHASLFRSRP